MQLHNPFSVCWYQHLRLVHQMFCGVERWTILPTWAMCRIAGASTRTAQTGHRTRTKCDSQRRRWQKRRRNSRTPRVAGGEYRQTHDCPSSTLPPSPPAEEQPKRLYQIQEVWTIRAAWLNWTTSSPKLTLTSSEYRRVDYHKRRFFRRGTTRSSTLERHQENITTTCSCGSRNDTQKSWRALKLSIRDCLSQKLPCEPHHMTESLEYYTSLFSTHRVKWPHHMTLTLSTCKCTSAWTSFRVVSCVCCLVTSMHVLGVSLLIVSENMRPSLRIRMVTDAWIAHWE